MMRGAVIIRSVFAFCITPFIIGFETEESTPQEDGILYASENESKTLSTRWPTMLIAFNNNVNDNMTVYKLSLEKTTWNTIVFEAGLGKKPGLGGNTHSDRICYHQPDGKIICHRNGTSYVLDVPVIRRYVYDLEEYNASRLTTEYNNINFSPDGDQIIWHMVDNGYFYIHNFKSGKSRRLGSLEFANFAQVEVDWDHGYIFGLRRKEILFLKILGNHELQDDQPMKLQTDVFMGIAIDTTSMTIYFIAETFIAKSSYRHGERSFYPNEILRGYYGGIVPLTVCYHNHGLFWTGKNEHPDSANLILRLDLKTLLVESKIVHLPNINSSIKEMIVFDNSSGAKNKANHCIECSDLCIPHYTNGYECGCPFEVSLEKTGNCPTVPVWMIVRKRNVTSGHLYLQTYDAIAPSNDSLLRNQVFSSSSFLLHPDGYCNSSGVNWLCYSLTGTLNVTWRLEAEVEIIAILRVVGEKAIVWIDSNKCLHYMFVSNTTSKKQTWILYCNSEIDVTNVVLDHINWHLFFRSLITGHLIHVDLTTASKSASTVNLDFSGDEVQPMRIVVDMNIQLLCYLSGSNIFRIFYDRRFHFIIPTEQISLLSSNSFDDNQQLKQKGDHFYWVRKRRNLLNMQETQVIVRFKRDLHAHEETFLKTKEGYEILAFDIESLDESDFPGKICHHPERCSHLCFVVKDNDIRCWCPEELPYLQDDGNCTLPPQPEISNLTKHVAIVVVVIVLFLVALNAIGFAVYRKYNDTRMERLIESFEKGNTTSAYTVVRNGADRAEVLPFTRILNPALLEVQSEDELGGGHFGRVCRGQYDGQEVAVKTLKGRLDFHLLQAFFKELKIMAYVGEHENIVHLLGADTSQISSGRIYAVVECASHGSLDKYLEKERKLISEHERISKFPLKNARDNWTLEDPGICFIRNIPNANNDESQKYQNIASSSELKLMAHNPTYDPGTQETDIEGQTCETSFSEVRPTNMSVPLMCHMSYQISRAMSFLTSKRIVHGDLATRNVLVFDDNVVKVTDFGLSRNMYQSSVYVTRNRDRPLPWKWLPPEALEYGQFSSMSDVWSYGVTLWEIFTFAKSPYAGCTFNEEFIGALKDGSLKLAKPELMPQVVYDGVVSRCFEREPEARMDFASIEKFWIEYHSPVA